MKSKTQGFNFLVTHLFLIFVDKKIFFKNIQRLNYKKFFITFEGFFKWQKNPIAIATVKEASAECR